MLGTVVSAGETGVNTMHTILDVVVSVLVENKQYT